MSLNDGPASNLRSRGQKSRKEVTNDLLSGPQHPNVELSDSNEKNDRTSTHFLDKIEEMSVLGFRHWIFIVILVASFYFLSIYIDSRLPKPLPDSQYSQFSEVRARRFLEKIVALGPRPSGSIACEKHATKLILDELQLIKDSTKKVGVNKLDIDMQRPSGCYDLGFLTDFTLCYRNVTNILVRFGPNSGPSEHSVLVNCHFDTMPDSPGATDDGVSCAIMIEMLHIFARLEKPLENDIIFLFNGAEENFLQASHGFITAHPWRHTIRAFVNLEGAGAGGRELLFQAGPGNGWLIKVYLETAPRPHCSVLGQEVFQSGIMPSDTDFRMFRDYGRVPGLDIAYVRNGYVYHTEFDLVKFIPAGAIQRAGENTMAAVRGLVSSPYLAHPGAYHEGGWVFYDVIGLFVLFYSQRRGEWINFISVGLVIFKLLWNFYRRKDSQMTTKKDGIPIENGYSPLLFLFALGTHLFALSAAILTGLFMTQLIGVLDLNMVWYGQPWLIFPLYFLPSIISALAVHSWMATKFYRKHDPFMAERCHFDAMLTIYAALLFFMTYKGLASAFMAMLHVVFPLCRDIGRHLIHSRYPRSDHNSSVLLFCHIFFLSPVILIACYSIMFVFEIFIPVMGRFGQVINPEFFILVLASTAACSFSLYTGSLIYVSRRIWFLLKCGWSIIFLLLLLLMTTRLGEPYKFHPDSPRLRRIIMLHVNRQIYSETDALITNENGLWALSMDYRGGEDLPMHGFMQGSKAPNCSFTNDQYCQLPYYAPLVTMAPASRTRWLAIPTPPDLAFPIKWKLTSKQKLANNRVNFTFTLDGPDHMSLHVSPLKGWKLHSWSFTDINKNFQTDQQTYFIFICYGQYSGPWNFWITLHSPEPEPQIDGKRQLEMSVASAYSHGPNQNSETMTQTLKLMRSRRETPQLAVGWWKWAIAAITGNSELISKYF